MDGINAFIAIIFLLVLCFVALLRATTLIGVFVAFLILTVVAYITIYMFKAEE